MHIWTITKWKNFYSPNEDNRRIGLRTRFEKGVSPEVRRSILAFCVWLRKNYFFPIRVVIYVKRSKKIRTIEGALVAATFFAPFEKNVEPYIRVATGDYIDDLNSCGKDNALAANLGSIAHELTHYFQWVNGLKLTQIGEERQANLYERFILDEYKETREHP